MSTTTTDYIAAIDHLLSKKGYEKNRRYQVEQETRMKNYNKTKTIKQKTGTRCKRALQMGVTLGGGVWAAGENDNEKMPLDRTMFEGRLPKDIRLTPGQTNTPRRWSKIKPSMQ
jgi:hypothetical protein